MIPCYESFATESPSDEALLELISCLKIVGYKFTTITPISHARIIGRGCRQSRDLRDVFGWSLPFSRDLLGADLWDLLVRANVVEPEGYLWRSRVRVSSLGGDLVLHSAYPTEEKDAVFFGPDSYRFARLITHELGKYPGRKRARLVDIGAGAGIGAIVASHCCPEIEITMTDINPKALRFARLNALAANVTSSFYLTDSLSVIDGEIDIILANPPFIIDDSGRDYRHGGALHGAEVSLDMAEQALDRLALGGRFILYTGSAITNGGHDKLQARLTKLTRRHGCVLRYEEIDPDIFGEELEKPAYRDIERIALIAAVVSAPDFRS